MGEMSKRQKRRAMALGADHSIIYFTAELRDEDECNLVELRPLPPYPIFQPFVSTEQPQEFSNSIMGSASLLETGHVGWAIKVNVGITLEDKLSIGALGSVLSHGSPPALRMLDMFVSLSEDDSFSMVAATSKRSSVCETDYPSIPACVRRYKRQTNIQTTGS
ncbi:hypothetical protein SAMD00023353_1600470 [Rosellinia necatrix]|uniref:Uncharacterized protein n=1 Tax=Rosellinia necatrix TaxID=77044 RepID=A0A1S8A868_ROSNE|nr:hypothetical protein SAMD00023353_1600470 [Rosellinia necatrix]